MPFSKGAITYSPAFAVPSALQGLTSPVRPIAGTEEGGQGLHSHSEPNSGFPFPDDLIQMDTKIGLLQTKKASVIGCLFSKGAITYSPAFAVPSALQGLTSLFGMGRGGALALSSP